MISRIKRKQAAWVDGSDMERIRSYITVLICLLGVAICGQWSIARGGALSSGLSVNPESGAPRTDAPARFPTKGRINAFVVFVQHRDDVYDNELTTDERTEWPARWSSSSKNRLPAWAGARRGKEGEQLLASPNAAPKDFAEGSLSQFYHLMSNGRFTVTGEVFPEVYTPEHDRAWYAAHNGVFENGASRLSHEILTSREVKRFFAEKYPGDAIRVFDRFTNGTDRMQPDGQFDLVILVYRLSGLPALIGKGRGYTSITSLGTYGLRSGDAFAAAGQPVAIGGLRVPDNLQSGSGVIVEGYTRKSAVRVIAHEIGHRQFYLAHTCEAASASSNNADCIGIMGGPYLTMSAPDRIKLGWAEVETVDTEAISGSKRYTLPDAIRSGKVLRIRSGKDDACGDLIVEARFWSNFWDRPPDKKNDDGDHGDFSLPQEGLYLYKASDGSASCGGPNYFFSSLERHGKKRDPWRGFRNGSTYRAAFVPGDAYTPQTDLEYRYHRNKALESKMALTAIARERGAFVFNIRRVSQ